MKTWKELMFNYGERVCTSNEVTTTEDSNPDMLLLGKQYVCLNPLKGPRSDANVAAHRNILFEFDKGSPEDQMKEVETTQLPYSFSTFSGNKSYHFVVCLEESLPADKYKQIVKQAYKKFKTVDKSCSNPSRFTRTPEGNNLKTGKYQVCLLRQAHRTPNKDFFDWLGPLEAELPPQNLKTEPAEGYVPLLNIFTKHYLAFGSEPGRRNSDLFKAACDMFKCGWNESEIFSAVAAVADLEMHEIKNTIKSAKRTTINDR